MKSLSFLYSKYKEILFLMFAFLGASTLYAQAPLHGDVTFKDDTAYVGGKRYCYTKIMNLGNNIKFFNFNGREIIDAKYSAFANFKILFIESGRTAQYPAGEAFITYRKALLKNFVMYEVLVDAEVEKKGELRFIRRFPDRDIFGKIIQKAGESLDNDLEQSSRDGFKTKEAESLKARNATANANVTDSSTEGAKTTTATVSLPNDIVERERTKPLVLENGEVKQDNVLVAKYSSNVTQWNGETTIIIKFFFPGGKQIAEARIALSKTTESEVITLKDNQKHSVATPSTQKEMDIAKFLLDRYFF